MDKRIKGTCRYCGREFKLNASVSDLTIDQADNLASDICECEQGAKPREKARKKKAFCTEVSGKYGETEPGVAWSIIVGAGLVSDPDSGIASLAVTTDEGKKIKVEMDGEEYKLTEKK